MHYIGVRDCQYKYGFYLVYSTRPKDPKRIYSIHIDIYKKDQSLTYQGSLVFPIDFSFLPVHRLAFLVDIPKTDRIETCTSKSCVHGRCIKYFN